MRIVKKLRLDVPLIVPYDDRDPWIPLRMMLHRFIGVEDGPVWVAAGARWR